jgi:hypothetical protein
MQIKQIEIRHFRSLKKLTWKPQRSNVICGINSSGKSNVRRALQFAFREAFDPGKSAENICADSPGPRTAAQIRLTFDKPTPAIATALGLPSGSQFSYSIQVRRSGTWTATVNDSAITEDQRLAFLSEVLVIYVPPLRDLAANGLQPFLTNLTNALLKMRSPQSFNSRAQALVSVVKTKGAQLLQATRDMSRSQLRVDQLLVDVDSVDLTKAFTTVGLKFKVGTQEHSLDKLGTGHQSAVILEMYRQLGEASKKFVLYLVEEPDNHMHLTAMRAMVDDLEECATRPNSQVFVTTHSAHMLNMFSLDSHLCLKTEGRLTEVRQRRGKKTEKELREAISRYGLTTAEAMLSRKILLVEGPADVTLFRTLIELQTGKTAEQQDIHIVSGSGKNGVKQLAVILQELGANYVAAFDWDATFDTSSPMFKSLEPPSQQALIAQLTAISADMRPVSPKNKSKPQKLIDNMIKELQTPPAFVHDFKRSELGQFLSDVHQLNAAAIDAIGATVGSGVRKYRPELEKHRIWLWTASPEEILIPTQAAESVAANELIAMEVLSALPIPANQRATILNAAHQLAHEPQRQIRLIRKLWTSNVVKREEIRNAVKFCI